MAKTGLYQPTKSKTKKNHATFSLSLFSEGHLNTPRNAQYSQRTSSDAQTKKFDQIQISTKWPPSPSFPTNRDTETRADVDWHKVLWWSLQSLLVTALQRCNDRSRILLLCLSANFVFNHCCDFKIKNNNNKKRPRENDWNALNILKLFQAEMTFASYFLQ